MTTILLLTAALLGLLAFFEPCTIATHTLFSVRLNQVIDNKYRFENLLAVWLSRTALLIGIFLLAVWLISTPLWSAYTPGIILTIMAMIYLVSRFLYIPIPHLEFFKLIPGGKRLPYAIHLGLTLPACTLPLVIVTAGMAIVLDSMMMAVVAGFLFSTMFTLPMLVTSYKGVNDAGKQLLNRAAKGSPYVTAILLVTMALYLFTF